VNEYRYTAAAALLAKYWPDKGRRHDAALALAGGLLAAVWTPDFIRRFMSAVCAAAKDDEERDRLAAVDSTIERNAAGENTTGWTTLTENLKGDGKKIVKRIKEWLGITSKKGRGKGRGEGEDEKESAATKLVKLATEAGVILFHSPEQTAYTVVPCDGHHETWPLKSTGFRRWLARLFYRTEEKAANAEAVANALNTMEGFALFDGEERRVYTRMAESGGKIYLDLVDAAWRVVEIDADGWRIVSPAPVHFRRSKGTLPLPVPERGGKLAELRSFVNVRNDCEWLLLLGWLFAAMRPRGPYPCLALSGEQGTAKSTLGRNLQKLIDPSVADLRSEPKEARDLMIAASASWLVAYDNLSHLPQWLSDCLCRLATGGGFGTRQLYTDDEEMLFNAMRPALLTSITDVVTAGDLLDRSVALQLETISDENRKTDEALALAFEGARPRILGALLDGLSAGLGLLPSVRLTKLPRMADFALWAEACLRGAGHKPGEFLEAYRRNRADVNAFALEASPLVPFLLRKSGFAFKGEASALLEELNGLADEQARKQKGWPAKPHILSGMLRRMAPNLRRAGMTVKFDREGKARKRIIELERDPDPESEGDEASAVSAIPEGPDFSPFCGTSYDKAAETSPESGERPPSVRLAPAERPPGQEADASPAWRPLGGRCRETEASALNSNENKPVTPMADAADASSRILSGFLADGTAYRVVRDAADLQTVLQALDESEQVGLDTETTGLNPHRDRVRLLQLSTDPGRLPSRPVRPRRRVRPVGTARRGGAGRSQRRL
jgi:hypothetical protein